jgi:hypothetical protein
VPRPRKISEEAKKEAWAIAHPHEEERILPEHHIFPKEWRLWLWAAALALALFMLAPKLSEERVTALLIFALFTFLFLLMFPLRHLPWILAATGKARQKRAWGAVAFCIALTITLGWAAWPDGTKKTGSSASASQVPLRPSQTSTTPQSNGLTLDNVRIEGFGSAAIQNHSGQLNFKESSITHNKIGLDNQNPNAQINFDKSQVSGNGVGIINRGSTKAESSNLLTQENAIVLADRVKRIGNDLSGRIETVTDEYAQKERGLPEEEVKQHYEPFKEMEMQQARDRAKSAYEECCREKAQEFRKTFGDVTDSRMESDFNSPVNSIGYWRVANGLRKLAAKIP